MIITKTYNYQIKRDHYTIFGHPSFKNTNVFHEYYDLIMRCPDVNRLGLIEMIKTFKPLSKSRIRITYGEDKIEFFKPNKYVFPEFHIEFLESSGLDRIITWEHPDNILADNLPVCGYLDDEIGQFDPRGYTNRPKFDAESIIKVLKGKN